ncbi:hypothetical protein SH528x_000612 [Novipirellula sp. SH528]|uniref:hypothetical protein n=1 Tax=Novipirellula sp. SH528 TaxID=3454466 RepID=UPI003FA0EB75
MMTKFRRVEASDLILVAISSFVLAFHSMPVDAKTETVAELKTPSVPKPISADDAVARWQAEVSQFYSAQMQAKAEKESGNMTDASLVSQISFVMATPSPSLASLTPPNKKEASLPTTDTALKPEPSPPQVTAHGFRMQSTGFSIVIAAVASICFAAWCVAFPIRRASPVIWASRWSGEKSVDASQSFSMNVDASWFAVDQPITVRARQLCFAVLVVTAMIVCVL